MCVYHMLLWHSEAILQGNTFSVLVRPADWLFQLALEAADESKSVG